MKLNKLMKLLVVFDVVAMITALLGFTSSPALAADAKGNKVKLDLYVMSQCPFGVQAENGIFPSVKSMEKNVDFNLHFIASEVPPAEGSADKKVTFRALHGQPEVDENIRHLCAKKHYPAKYMDFILERNKAIRDPNWQEAAKKTGLDPQKIEACFSGGEGTALHSEDIKAASARGASGSPTIDIEGKPYQGARGQKSITLALCGALKAKGVAEPEACKKALSLPDDAPMGGGGCGDGGAKPAAAANPPANTPLAFDIQVVVDNACKACGPTLVNALKRQHPGANLKTIDAQSNEGKALIAQHRVRTLPLYLLDKKVEQDPNFTSLLDSFYAKSGDRYIIRPGQSSYVPNVQLSRERAPRHLDIFVSALSPFAVQAQLELARFLSQSKAKDLTFSMHYIVQEGVKAEATDGGKAPAKETRSASLSELKNAATAGPLTSLRGETELKESLRQVCLFQKASIGAFFSYIDCRGKNLQDAGRAEACLQMDEAVKTCVEGPEGEQLLRQDARLVRDIGIESNAAVMWENRYGPFGWNEVDWKGLIEESK